MHDVVYSIIIVCVVDVYKRFLIVSERALTEANTEECVDELYERLCCRVIRNCMKTTTLLRG
jgi:hypothetical protein